ncbi:DUF503 domain-containing protein [Clostridium sp. NSJ-49]|uniref:Ylxp-like protein n=1 Tax=Clostridium disporicum TaxID=84024 RepID=A0A174LFB7_9CLOT|nr:MULTISPECIES: DUF503 domain-containing protein [Clostridium]MBC5624838.1 DUF503 domain-containing protein [Clostridium sp. NSJ-49]MCD2500565.1 DUF503 domain-containing protein [Clostridium sp. NSJ-145]MDU6340038.1 DUF503 domain-containing protein [Clostridium sp.]CUP21416.1 ylxp-like protein [Clostridium disporicum]
MKVLVLVIKLRASWVHSLKEKRMILLSITKRLKNKYNVSVGEVGEQDTHKIIQIGISQVATSKDVLYASKEDIITFIEENCEAEIIDIEEEIIDF